METLQLNNILIIGLPGSGKTTLSMKLKYHHPIYKVICMDDYIYEKKEGWIRRPSNVVANDIFDIIYLTNNNVKFPIPIILESSYNDGSDPHQTRMNVINKLIEDNVFTTIIRITPVSLQETIESLFVRSSDRRNGNAEQGTCVETSSNVAKMLIKNVNNYSDNVSHLNNFIDNVHHKKYNNDTYDKIRIIEYKKNDNILFYV